MTVVWWEQRRKCFILEPKGKLCQPPGTPSSFYRPLVTKLTQQPSLQQLQLVAISSSCLKYEFNRGTVLVYCSFNECNVIQSKPRSLSLTLTRLFLSINL